MAKEPRPKGYPKLKNYKPSQFMLPTSHYDKAKADRAVCFVENLCHTKGKWAGKRFWLLPWQEQLIRDIFGIVKPDGNRQLYDVLTKGSSDARQNPLHFIITTAGTDRQFHCL
jgi:hypothetical protein